MSRWYDFIAGGSERKFMDLGIKQLHPQPGEHILEIGCGTGHGLISLAMAVSSSGYIFGLDISDGMLTQTRAHLSKKGLSYPVYLQLGDACHLPYSSNVFSAVFFSFTLELFDTPDIPLVLAECERILKADGRIGIVCLSKQGTLPVRIYERFHEIMPALVDCRPILVQPILIQAAFKIIATKSKNMWGLPVDIVTAKITKEPIGGKE
ncbi:MAG: hypothetical protein A2X25_04365 [Chloroflexi bacterium GWB2_49_20]|nr:MAG: hypothetical protein A2X25_04365 [Chloroflexi bacterium GWB2_49_20]OGN78654.1 MAG: hypothetical protein A2X26_12425 [Chloroflexi bacterium GWC2_49_37]OGN85756.1 MAG: hypothetical protein A2X27_00895 [Chloroflexi bacterium GWD2_49_16]HBG75060.1 2-heptaprenyl-1,4-naphthoquinone methyltransferase [Anaerolineae bacterium]HCC78085.1 2-heptaprenyl-1,4-naphthoquinone methyltransferase [Anaerolineae bacterium]